MNSFEHVCLRQVETWLGQAWVELATGAEALVVSIAGLVSSLAALGLRMEIVDVVFLGTFLSVMFNGDLLLQAVWKHGRGSKRMLSLSARELLVFIMVILVIVVIVGYIAFHVLKMALAFGFAYVMAMLIKLYFRKNVVFKDG